MKPGKPGSDSVDPGEEDKRLTPPEDIPPHPTKNWKDIAAFLVVLMVSPVVPYGLSLVWSSLYVIVGGWLVGLVGLWWLAAGILGLGSVFCSRCRLAMSQVRLARIGDRSWEIYRCELCRGEWRVKDEEDDQALRGGVAVRLLPHFSSLLRNFYASGRNISLSCKVRPLPVV